MSDTGELPELEELEPLEEAAPAAAPPPQAAAAGAPQGARPFSGLPTPFYNPAASTEYYRFLFAGVLIVVGCLMPFGPEWGMAGYKTLTGGFIFIIGLGLVWSMWGAISIGRPPSMKWLGFCLLPFIWGIFKVIGAFDAPAVVAFTDAGGSIVTDWGELFSIAFDKDQPERFTKVGNFFRYFGPGKILVFLGAFLVEFYFIKGIFGGAKQIKQQKAQRQASARSRR